jgi:hypothetical protein
VLAAAVETGIDKHKCTILLVSEAERDVHPQRRSRNHSQSSQDTGECSMDEQSMSAKEYPKEIMKTGEQHQALHTIKTVHSRLAEPS